MTLGLQPGQHTISIRMTGYDNWVQRVTVEAGATLKLAAALTKSK